MKPGITVIAKTSPRGNINPIFHPNIYPLDGSFFNLLFLLTLHHPFIQLVARNTVSVNIFVITVTGFLLWPSVELLRQRCPHSSFITLSWLNRHCVNLLPLAAVREGGWAIKRRESRKERERGGSAIYSPMTPAEDRVEPKARLTLCLPRRGWIYGHCVW